MISIDKRNLKEYTFTDFINYDKDHNREEVSFITKDIEIVTDYVAQGWSYKENSKGFIVRAPEEWLVDLSDPYKIIKNGGVLQTLAKFLLYREWLQKGLLEDHLLEVAKKFNLNNLKLVILKGEVLETEIRIAFSDNRSASLKDFLNIELLRNPTWNYYYKEAKELLKKHRSVDSESITVEELPVMLQNFFFSAQSQFTPFVSNRNKEFFNKIYLKNIFSKTPKADVYIFVPNGCFRYLSSFVRNDNIGKIMFWEVHADRDNFKLNRRYLSKDLRGKKVCIIDNIYSGNTFKILKKEVKKEGGEPFCLGLFPKNLQCTRSVDYVLFGDRIIDTSIIKREKDWMINTYVETFKK